MMKNLIEFVNSIRMIRCVQHPSLRVILLLIFAFFVASVSANHKLEEQQESLEIVSSSEALQDTRTIEGKVLDGETSAGLPGVTIIEKGTSNGTTTDLDGKFIITVPNDAVLLISYVGYITEEIQVSTRTDFTITLLPDLISLDDVVVIGYGTVKKSDLTGAVTSVSVDELKQSAVSGVDQALQGRAAGVSVTSNSGTPGTPPTILIRGMGTVTNSDPFFIIDGMPVTADAVGALNPGDIESMEILKDASAAAIYGARAANGVVLITTKKGKTGKMTVSFDAYAGVQSITKKYDLTNASEFITLRNAVEGTNVDPESVTNTDWQDEIFRKAGTSSYQLSFLGGSEKFKYALVGSYYNQHGIVKGSSYERYTARLNTSTDMKDWLTVGQNLSLSTSTQNIIPEQNEWTSVVIQALTMDPTTPVYDSLGQPNASIRNNIGNPVGAISRNHNVLKTNKVLGNIYAEIKPVDWLSYKLTFGTDITSHRNVQFSPVFYESTTLNATTNNLIKGRYDFSSFLMENLLTFNKSFNKHDLQAIAGYTRQRDKFRRMVVSAQDVPEDPNLWFVTNAADPSLNISEDVQALISDGLDFPVGPTDNSIVSYLGRIIYSYDNKIDLTASVRHDGSSKFGKDRRWGTFKSFAGGWRISSMPFMANVDFISFLKLRLGWGELGNQEIGDYRAFTNVTPGFNYTFGTYGNQETYPGGAPISFANSEIHWEVTKQTNIGLDFNLFSNKLAFNIDYFIRNTNDMLVDVPVPLFTGIQQPPTVNTGSVRNKGWELSGTYKERIGDFSYSIGVNFSSIQNEVTDLGGEGIYIPSAEYRATGYISRTEVGQPIASYYGYVTDGYWQTQEEIDEANENARIAAGRSSAFYDRRETSPGDVKFKDLNGDSLVTGEDQTYIGSPHPKFTYGINLNLEYKSFDLQVFGQGIYGNDVFMATIYYLESPTAYWNMLPSMLNYWQQAGDNPEVPRLDSDNGNNNLRFSDRYVKNGSYFRLKNIQLGYTLPSSISERMGIERFRIYLAGQNILSIHNYPGFDPEIGSGRDQGTSTEDKGNLDIGIDRGMYPIAKMYSVGINITF